MWEHQEQTKRDRDENVGTNKKHKHNKRQPKQVSFKNNKKQQISFENTERTNNYKQ